MGVQNIFWPFGFPKFLAIFPLIIDEMLESASRDREAAWP
jgi:hypothetical protein